MADEPTRDDEGSMDAPDATSTDLALAVAARHTLHDEELVVALASGSLDDQSEIERARSLVDRCTACRELDADILAISTALRIDARGTMRAPRDFRLTVEDARRLGGPVAVGGFLARFRRGMQGFAPQIGASMAALGVVGILVGSVTLSGGAAMAPTSAGTGQTAASAPAVEMSGAEQPGPKASDRSAAYGPLATAAVRASDAPATIDSAGVDSNPAVWLLGGSIALLVAGLVLLVVAFRRGRTSGSSTRDS